MNHPTQMDIAHNAQSVASSRRKKIGLLLFCTTVLFALLILVMAGWSAVVAHGLRQGVPTVPPINVLPNGVAAGDVTQDSVVLWARNQFTGIVTFTYFIDPGGTPLFVTSTVTNAAIPAKVMITGLNANTTYLYTATTSAGQSGGGQFRTPAEFGTSTGLRIGASGDWRGELRPYPAISNVPDRNLDLFLKLGDTIYADFPSPAVQLTQTTTIEDFRKKHSEVYGLLYQRNFWAEVQAKSSILAMLDDHEVTNNFAGGANADTDARFPETTGLINDTAIFENGVRAFGEYNPINTLIYSTTGDTRTDGEVELYRYRTYGSDAAFFVIDARSFRDEAITPINAGNPLGDLNRFITDSFQSGRTLLGERQLQRLKADLIDATQKGIVWKFIAIPEPIQLLGPAGAEDRFEGYAAERTELLDFIVTNAITNVVFIAADYHGTIVNNLTYQANATAAYTSTGMFEVTTGSVAFDMPLGPTAVEVGVQSGLISQEQKALYDSLPVNNDLDDTINDKDDFVKANLHQQYTLLENISSLEFDRIGLGDTDLINAQLLQGDYLAVHTYGWTEFEIAPGTQVLTVTTYGIEPYTEADMITDFPNILTRTQTIVSQFRVIPEKERIPVYLPVIYNQSATTGTASDHQFNIAIVQACERQPAGSWFEGTVSIEGEASNGQQVVFSFEPDGEWATQPAITGPHPGYPGWAPGYYSHIISAGTPQVGDWYVWIVNDAKERISEIAHWRSTGPGEGCNQAIVDFDSRQ